MLEMLSGGTRLFPIIGDPVIYAKSPERLTRSFAARGHNGVCVPMQVPGGNLEGVMHGLSLIPNVDGLLVTMPHKFTAYAYCATSSDTSRLLKVVSVMRRNSDGSWHGDMLDGLAFVKAQKDEGAQPKRARVLLVGAGGAGSAIAIAMLASGLANWSSMTTTKRAPPNWWSSCLPPATAGSPPVRRIRQAATWSATRPRWAWLTRTRYQSRQSCLNPPCSSAT
jgi:shikimate 5-dehydrogenase